jgi:NAD(P)-dependent dehydrogenase (short-subunit alcohol dehydrogenase family)
VGRGSSERAVPKTLWITGAGSGMGKAAALVAARAGWDVALSGRGEAALQLTAAEIRGAGGTAFVAPLDVRDAEATRATSTRVLARNGRIDALVLAAGLNSPRRLWENQSMSDFDAIVETNLTAPAHLIQMSLPALRESGGIVIIVSSYSAWTFSPHAGVAYTASKSGLLALTRTINSQEASFGVRACHLCPGDVDTGFLALRPVVPDESAREEMLDPFDVARAIQFVLDSPAHVRFDELVVSPISQT